MGKVFALLLILLAAGAGYGGYLTHNNIAIYNEHKPKFIESLGKSLGEGLALNCHSDSSLFGIIQTDQCAVFMEGNRLLNIWHKATIEPFRAHGEFGVDGQAGMLAMVSMLAPSLFEDQKGEWALNPIQQQVTFSYQTGASNGEVTPQHSLNVEPLIISGYVNLTGKRDSFTSIALAQFAFIERGSDNHVTLKNFYTDIKGAEHRGVLVAERSEFKLDVFSFEYKDSSIRINSIASKGVGSIDGKFTSSLGTLEFANLTANYASHNLHMDKTELSIFVDKIDLDATLKMQDDPIMGLLSLATQGLSIYLDNASTSFTYQDRRSGMLGTAGDFRLTGSVKFPTLADIPDDPLQLLDQVQAELNINASPSLSYGPQANIVMEFIATGWIENSTNRLTSKLELKEGVATINGLPVNALQLIPQYDEDH